MKYIKSRPVIGREQERSSVGHNFTNWSTGLFLAKRFNLEYIHSPFTGDSERFELFLNLYSIYKKVQDISPSRVVTDLTDSTRYFNNDNKLPLIQKALDSYPENTLIDLPMDSYPGILTQYYNDIIPDLQRAYWAIPRNNLLMFDGNKISVAIHVRRGDIKKDIHPSRWLNLDYYLNVINNLNNILDSKNIDIHVFSEGVTRDFKPLLKKNVHLHLGGCDLAVFHNMCSANILVTGKSTYSLMAAYINRGVIIYTPLSGAGGDPEKQYTHKWGDDRILLGDNLDYQLIKNKF